MINNDKVRNCTKPFPIMQGLTSSETLGKIRLKNLYQNWNGESVAEISAKHDTNPYTVRIGTPNTDDALRNDRMYFIPNYLAYNPITQLLENRDLISRRVMDRLYIGQTTREGEYDDYKVFVAGKVVADDLYLTASDQLSQVPLSQVVVKLLDRIEQLTKEVVQLKAKVNSKPIYRKQTNQ